MSLDNNDQYLIRGKIGEGGMGVVYLAEDTALQRPVAIKELTRPVAPGQDAAESRFQQEALALARLNHPNITHLYAFLPKGDTYWMVMEYVPGRTLEEWLHYRGKMNPGLACSIVVQMLEGLQHAHRKGIIHRDLKPSNVMISEEGEVKIMDFGIARIRDSQRITRHGKSVGTLAYMAPEQIRGDEGDERTDIYAAGNILYELLSGHTPFEADTDYHLMKLKLEEAPRPLAGLGAQVPPGLQKAIFKALERNPARRYESAAALKEDLAHHMQGKLLKADVLYPMLSDLQQEEAFVQAVKENPLRQISGMVKALPVRAAAGKLSGTLRQVGRMQGTARAWWLLAASVIVCAMLLLWFNHDDAPVVAGGQQELVASPEGLPAVVTAAPETAASKKAQPPIIEQELQQHTGYEGSSYSAPKAVREPAPPAKPAKRPVPERSRQEPGNAPEKESRSRYDRGRPTGDAPAPSGPVAIPAGREIRVALDETLSSEAEDRDGSPVRLHCTENVVVDGQVVIRRGAPVTGKIVDVRTSANARRGAIIGFVIQHVQAADGTMLKLRSERFRNEAAGAGQPVYYRSGQLFSAELKGGRLR